MQAAIPAYEAWVTALRTEAMRATNVELKAALTAMESELGKLIAVMATANAIDSILPTARLSGPCLAYSSQRTPWTSDVASVSHFA